jgi:site-specific recombinase XerD
VDPVRPFVVGRVGRRGVDPERVAAGDVTSFVVAESSRLAPKTLQRSASALRSLLRYWHLEGLVTTSLVEAVPKVASRAPRLPGAVEPGEVAALLACCDRERVDGLRDYAMLMLLSRLGLGCGEVAALQLDDVDWRGGQISVRGVRATAGTCSRYRSRSGRRWWTICVPAARPPRWGGRCSYGSQPRTGG